jgi:hypothetical protein
MPPTPYYRHILTMCGVLRWSGGFTLPREVVVSFNDEMMFQAVSNTCHRSIGRRARDIASSGPCN